MRCSREVRETYTISFIGRDFFLMLFSVRGVPSNQCLIKPPLVKVENVISYCHVRSDPEVSIH